MKHLFLILSLLCHLSIYSQENSKPTNSSTWKLNFIVSTMDGTYIPDITFHILPQEKAKLFSFSYSQKMGYIVEYDDSISLTENMILQVNHEMYEPISIELLRLRDSKRIYLGKKGMRYFRQGNLDLPFVASSDKAGGILLQAKKMDESAKILLKKGLAIQNVTTDLAPNMAIVRRMDGLNLEQEDYLWLRESGIFSALGPIVNIYLNVFGFMHHSIGIQFKNTTSAIKRKEVYQKFGLKEIEGNYRFSPYHFANVEAPKTMGLEMLTLADSIRNHPYVKLADVQFYQHIGHRNINYVDVYKTPVSANIEPDNASIAIMLRRRILSNTEMETYRQLIQELALEPAISPFSPEADIKMFDRSSDVIYYFTKTDKSPFARFNCSILEKLRASEFVAAAGYSTTGNDIIQNEMLVHFVRQDKEKAMALLEKHHIEIIGGSANYMLAKANLDIGIGIFDLKAILQQSGLFTIVQMNPVSRIQFD